MNEEELKKSNEILKRILKDSSFKKLSSLTSKNIYERGGKEYSNFDKSVVTNLINKFIIHIGYCLSNGITISDFEKMCNPIYKEFIQYDSIQELYDEYREFIEVIRVYYTNNKK